MELRGGLAAVASDVGRQPEPYHRQVPGGPVIVVRNGFLDTAPPSPEGPTPAGAGSASQRAVSAPAKVCAEAVARVKGEGDNETDVDSHSACSCGESQYNSGASAASRSGAPTDRASRRAGDSGDGDDGVTMMMTIESPNGTVLWPATPRRGEDLPAPPPLGDSWLLPEAWSPPAPLGGGSSRGRGSAARHGSDDGQGSDAGLSWVTPASPQLSAWASPAWSCQPSPLLVAAVSPVVSPQLLPQPAPVGPWQPQQQQQQQQQQPVPPLRSQPGSPFLAAQPGSPFLGPRPGSPLLGSQHSSPYLSPQPSPHLPPQAAPSPLLLQLAQSLAEASDTAPLDRLFSANLHRAAPVTQAVDGATGLHRVLWTVDATKLRSNERQMVSPSFELLPGTGVTYKLVILPKAHSDGKGGATFRKSAGCGSVHLKCEASASTVSFWMSITDGTAEFPRQRRGPVTHNFAEHSTCGLPKHQNQWDFNKAVNKTLQSFAVCLDILPESNGSPRM